MTSRKIPLHFYIEHWLLKGLRRILRSLSPGHRRHLAHFAGNLVYFLIPYRRSIMHANLRRAFPNANEKWRRRIIQTCYRHFAQVYFDFFPLYEASAQQFDSLVECHDLNVLNDALSQKRGVVLVLFHFGNWEVCADWFARHGYGIAAVAKKMKNPLADRLFLAARTHNGLQILYKTKANSPRIWKFLRAENILYLLADQDARRNGIFVKFFDQWSSSYRGPALFTLRQKAPLVAGWCLLQDNGKYIIRLKELGTSVPTEYKNEPIAWLTQQIAHFFEEQIQGCPEQYYWFHRRWKTKPPSNFMVEK
ncbi:MAG: hypothetical protein V1681_05345 [Candidatus Neomarinimicrobiota bacterium]